MSVGGYPRSILTKLREIYPLAFHGVGLSIGSTEPLRPSYLKELRALISEFAPFLVSDHLSWTRHGGHTSHDLLPIPYTQEALAHVQRRVESVQDFLGRKIYLENPSAYVSWNTSQMSEPEFLRELCARTGCGVLLDLNNLVVNSHNLGQDPQSYLREIAKADVGQFHLAGHSRSGLLRVDTHDEAPDIETIRLFQQAQMLWPQARPLLEWDDKLPEFSELLEVTRGLSSATAQKLSSVASHADSAERSQVEAGPLKGRGEACTSKTVRRVDSTLAEAQEKLWTFVHNRRGVAPFIEEIPNVFSNLPGHPVAGVHVYNSGYFARIHETLGKVFPALQAVCQEAFREIVKDYLEQYRPKGDSVDFAGEHLVEFLAASNYEDDIGVPGRVLADIAAYELARLQVFLAADDQSLTMEQLHTLRPDQWLQLKLSIGPNVRLLDFEYDVVETVHQLRNGEQPPPPERMPQRVLVARSPEHEVIVRALTEEEARFLLSLQGSGGLLVTIQEEQFEPARALQLLNQFAWLLTGGVQTSECREQSLTLSI